jgi:hypothetical protein
MVTRTRLNVTLYVHRVVIVVVVDLYQNCLCSKLFQNMLISFDRVSKTEHPKHEETLSPTLTRHPISRLANTSEGNCPNWLYISKTLFRVLMRIFKGKIRHWSLPQIIINYCIIMTNKNYNYIIHALGNYYISSRNVIKCGSNCGCYYLLFKKKKVTRFVPCHVFAQSPPDRRPNDKYPVNTSRRSDLYKNVSLQCYLVATVIHTQTVRGQIWVHEAGPESKETKVLNMYIFNLQKRHCEWNSCI